MKESLKAKAYRKIKEKIITCEYPPNMYSNEEFFQGELNISRTPIRDALGRLEQEGLVKILPKKGVVITDITIEGINQLFQVRSMLEEHGIMTYGNSMDRNVLLEMKKRFQIEWDPKNIMLYHERNELHKLYEIDIEFHRYISNFNNNFYVESLYKKVQNQEKRIRYYTGLIVDPQYYLSKQEPEVIINSILEGRLEEAVIYSRLHIATAKNSSLLAWIKK